MFIIASAVLSSVIGAFFRRWWGGWLNHDGWHWLKIGVCFGLGFVIAGLGLLDPIAALAFGVCLVLTMLNPMHSLGQRMGFGGTPKLAGSIAFMSGSYAAYTIVTSIVLFGITGKFAVLLYAPAGVLASGGYLLGWYVLPRFFGGTATDPTYTKPIMLGGQAFIDGPTAIGELVLGAVLFGAAGVALWLT